jgi:hypothetical protein
MQAENKWVVAGDVLFSEGGYQLGAASQQSLSQYVPRLQNLQNAKVVVYGYADNLPVGPILQRAGIKDNIDLSSKRADNVVAYFRAQGINPNIISAKSLATPILSPRTTRRTVGPRTAASRSCWRAPAPKRLADSGQMSAIGHRLRERSIGELICKKGAPIGRLGLRQGNPDAQHPLFGDPPFGDPLTEPK